MRLDHQFFYLKTTSKDCIKNREQRRIQGRKAKETKRVHQYNEKEHSRI
jgi:hypothetical protein